MKEHIVVQETVRNASHHFVESKFKATTSMLYVNT